MQLIVITPENTIIEKEVSSITVPTDTGEITILPGHVSLLTTLKLGNISFKTEGKNDNTFITIERGVLSTDGNSVKILADIAINSEESHDDRMEQIKENAQNIMKNAPKDMNLEKLKSQQRIIDLHLSSKKRRKI